MDVEERRWLVRVALRAVVGDEVERLRVEDDEHAVRVGDPDTPWWFGVWTSDDALGDEPPPYLEHVIDELLNDLSETRAFWGVRLPLCPRHPDVHALALRVTAAEVVGTCPTAGVVRTVPC